MTTGERHSFLIILRFNKDDKQHPLDCGAISDQGHLQPVIRAQSSLVVAIVDPAKRSATTPMVSISLDNNAWRVFNSVLELVGDLNLQYRGERGYLSNPQTFTQNQQSDVLGRVQTIGTKIRAVLAGERGVVKDWLDDLFKQHEAEAEQFEEGQLHHVTIITNDFSVPWYWLYSPFHDRFLCETVSLGMLQLASFSDVTRDDGDQNSTERVLKLYKALLINGAQRLPFTKSELDGVAAGLERVTSDTATPLTEVTCQKVASNGDLSLVYRKNARQQARTKEFRLIHFTGAYSSDDLMLDDEPIEERDLELFVDRSLFVLDGCSSAAGIRAWTDLYRVTAHFMRQGAAGCLLPVLPVKNDPIVAEVFWGAFYKGIRTKGFSLGGALLRARRVLKEHLREIGSPNPVWILYQLIGNPSVEVFAEPRDKIEPR